MRQMRLVKDAPWPSVTLPSGVTLKKTDWVEFVMVVGMRAIGKYVEYREKPEEIPVEEPIEPVVEKIEEAPVEKPSKKKSRKVQSEVPPLPDEMMGETYIMEPDGGSDV